MRTFVTVSVSVAAAVLGLFSVPVPALAGERVPVVFEHGLGITGGVYEILIPLKKFFADRGYELLIAETPSAGHLAERARILNDEIQRLVPTGRYHLIAHSMGGVDSRLAIHEYGLGDRVMSLTMLSSPNRGSPLADFVMAHPLDPRVRVLHDYMDAISDLTIDKMTREFNPRVTDDPRVRYFSMGFYIPAPTALRSFVPWLVVLNGLMALDGEPRNDGMVPVDSARWGEFLGAFPADHYSETGPIPLIGGVSYLQTFGRVLDRLDRLDDRLAASGE
jgi:triacylglycerol lipase